MKRDRVIESVLNGEKEISTESELFSLISNRRSSNSFSIIRERGESPHEYQEMKSAVRAKGHGFIELAVIHEEDEQRLSRALVIIGISKRDLLSIAQLHSQDSVIMRKMDGFFVMKRGHVGPPDSFTETFVSALQEPLGIIPLFFHIYKNPKVVLERESVSIWNEWYIALKRGGDDTHLWKKIA